MYIERAVKSLINQDFSDWECIIVDDGSIDTTYEILKPYLQEYPQIRYMYHSNRGTGSSRNVGILASSGLFITFLDSDDEYLPDHLSTRKTVLEDYPMLHLLHGGVEIIGDEFVVDKNDNTQKIHLQECVIGGTFVMRKDYLLELGGFSSIRYADDADLFQRIVDKQWNIGKIDYPSYRYYRDTPDSLCTNQGT